MGRYFLLAVIMLHAVMHLISFAAAFDYIESLRKTVFYTSGVAWLTAGILLLSSAVCYLIKKEYWWLLGLMGVCLSQCLIITSWNLTKFATVGNAIILPAIVAAFGNWLMKHSFHKDVARYLLQEISTNILSEKDLLHLPEPVTKYITYSGSLNKPISKNFKLAFEGELRSRNREWMPFTSEQYNFCESPARLFYLNAKMMQLPVTGYHCYKDGIASMKIRLAGIIPIVNKKGNELDIAETVTYFNDLCIYAPSMLADNRIKWEPIDNRSAKAYFTNQQITISAILIFNEKGQLVNFISDDRYDINEKKRFRFSTPIRDYKMIDGLNVAAYGEAIWHFPEGEFTYGKFRLKQIKYNVH